MDPSKLIFRIYFDSIIFPSFGESKRKFRKKKKKKMEGRNLRRQRSIIEEDSSKSVSIIMQVALIMEGAQVAERLLGLVPIINEGSTNGWWAEVAAVLRSRGEFRPVEIKSALTSLRQRV